jgi:protein-L-isoaspartate(D-aspartate) O-methyltransferase
MALDPYEQARLRMVDEQLHGRGIRDERVLGAMSRVPRHEFVAREFADKAYGDYPVPVPARQTVSQPYIVAAMIESLHLQDHEKVLEIGTGTGYQAAVLAELARVVYTIERHETLAGLARENLERLGYRNVQVVYGDGTVGLPQHAPFDAIIVAAAAPQVPPALVEQLAPDGRMILPVGTRESQALQLIYRRGEELLATTLEGCRFVPLLGEEGFEETE